MNFSLPLAFVMFAGVVLNGLPAASSQDISFSHDIQPILSENCYQCHGPDENGREADLRLDQRSGLFGEGSDGPIVAPKNPTESLLLQRILSEDADEIMPPADSNLSLTPEQKNRIRRWIEQGAPWEQLWSLVPPRKSPLPSIRNRNWPRNAIDYYIAARLEEKKLRPAEEAKREKLIRRVYLDLTGIPPTWSEVQAFLDDPSPNAYETLVDRLLASPMYGERMAWPWLDAARYADSNGYQGDGERTMWPWRDWVVEAMNDDLPFDEFTRKQIAGDLLPGATDSDRLATGFCRNHMINGEGGRIPEENRVEYIFDQIETVATIWMGVTFNCCRCHDHKFDPYYQNDYYAMFGIFNSTPVDGSGGNPATPPVLVAPSRLQKRALQSLEPELNRLRKVISDRESNLFPPQPDPPPKNAKPETDLPDAIKNVLKLNPGARNSKQLSLLEKHFQKPHPDYVKALEALRKLSDRYNAIRNRVPKVMVMADTRKRKTYRLDRGLYNQPREELVPALPKVFQVSLDHEPNRLDLADWLVSSQNPLTARVTVNRHWQMFFGQGLVKTPEDFGAQGDKPSHPELLDRLAVELIESGWDIKQLHRNIVTSATYRQSARVNHRAREIDPENRLLAYSPRFRMPSWMLRDQALAIGDLLVHDIGGPAVRPYQPAGIWAEATFGKKKYVQDKGARLYRRSLYTFWRRIIGPTMFFDAARRQTCEVKTSLTNSPLHSLVTFNDPTYVEAARGLASFVSRNRTSLDERIRLAFARCTGRNPSPVELELLIGQYELALKQFKADTGHRDRFLSVGEFRPQVKNPDELAGLAFVCLTLLNLDETLNR